MVCKKKDALEALRKIPDIKGGVTMDRPEKFTKLPALSYYEINNSPAETADDTEYFSAVNLVIDIWAESHAEADRIAIEVDKAMTEIRFRREFSRDVPESSSRVKHKTTRYEYIGG